MHVTHSHSFFYHQSSQARPMTRTAQQHLHTPHRMPKRGERWSDIPPPSTPLQRGAYLDACTAWMVSEPDHPVSDDLEIQTTDPIRHVYAGCDDGVSRSFCNRRDRRSWKCVVCHVEVTDSRPQIGNPFAQHCLVVTCQDCSSRTGT